MRYEIALALVSMDTAQLPSYSRAALALQTVASRGGAVRAVNEPPSG